MSLTLVLSEEISLKGKLFFFFNALSQLNQFVMLENCFPSYFSRFVKIVVIFHSNFNVDENLI